MPLLFDPRNLWSGCCNRVIIGSGRYFCSFCRMDLTRDMWCVNRYLETGDKMWIYTGHGTYDPTITFIPRPVAKQLLTAAEWLERKFPTI